MQYLINHGAEVNFIPETLHNAIMSAKDSLEKAKILIDNGANLNYWLFLRGTPLQFAKQRGKKEIAKLIEEKLKEQE